MSNRRRPTADGQRRDPQTHIACPLCGGLITATQADWSCVNGHGGPNLTMVSVHTVTCPQGLALMGMDQGKGMPARDADEYALPHTCMPGGFAGEHVIQTKQLVSPHAYRPGKVHPVGLKDPLCRDCRNPRRGHPL